MNDFMCVCGLGKLLFKSILFPLIVTESEKYLVTIININKCKLFINVMSSWNINNNQLILEGLIRAMPQLTERNHLM